MKNRRHRSIAIVLVAGLLSACAGGARGGHAPAATDRVVGSSSENGLGRLLRLDSIRSEEEAVASSGGARIYFPTDGAVVMHDRERNHTVVVYQAPERYVGAVSYLTLSRAGDMLAFARDSADEIHVVVLPLDPATGLAAGPLRRISAREGDTPAFSPDGRRIAFVEYGERDQELVVAALDGGERRIVASLFGGIEPIRWSPDGEHLYFGAIPPASGRQLTLRVPAAGGSTDTVAVGRSTYPGLSPDGRFLVIGGGPGGALALTPDGDTLGLLTLPTLSVARSWYDEHTLLLVAPYELRIPRTLDLSTLARRDVMVPLPSLSAPAWSPDGSRLAFADPAGERILLRDPRRPRWLGSVDVPIWNATDWSPDGRWILFRAPTTPPSIQAVEVSSGRVVELARGTVLQPSWNAASTGIVYALAGGTVDANGARRLEMRAANLDGSVRELGSFLSTCARFLLVDDTTAVISVASGETLADDVRRTIGDWYARFACVDPLRLVRLPDLTPIADVVDGPLVTSRMTRSRDGRWVAFRATGRGLQGRDYERAILLRSDGSRVIELDLPFAAATGRNGVLFQPDGDAIVLSEDEDSIGVHRLDLETRALERIASVTAPGVNPADYVDLSPDGRVLAVVEVEPQSLRVAGIDVAAALGMD